VSRRAGRFPFREKKLFFPKGASREETFFLKGPRNFLKGPRNFLKGPACSRPASSSCEGVGRYSECNPYSKVEKVRWGQAVAEKSRCSGPTVPKHGNRKGRALFKNYRFDPTSDRHIIISEVRTVSIFEPGTQSNQCGRGQGRGGAGGRTYRTTATSFQISRLLSADLILIPISKRP
jgi:hypothetical protein